MAGYVTAVNRSKKPLDATWDGKVYQLKPGDNWLPENIALAAKRQNPIMGTEDPYTLESEFLVGIKEHGDDVTPAKQSEQIELLNRKKLVGAKPTEVVVGNGPLTRATVSTAPMAQDTNFVAP